MSRRVKITFQSVNAGRITVIDPAAIAEARRRIAAAMREHERALSRRRKSASDSV